MSISTFALCKYPGWLGACNWSRLVRGRESFHCWSLCKGNRVIETLKTGEAFACVV